MSVEPGAVNLVFVDFTSRQESLCVLSVYHISVHVHVVKGVVLTDTLGLVIKLLRRVEVVDSDVIYCFNIVVDIRSGKGVIRRECLYVNVVQLVGKLSVLDVSFQILTFLVDFVRRYDKILNQHSGACAYKPHNYHDYRNRKEALIFFSAHLHDEHNRRQNRQNTEDSVHPKGNVHIRKACAVNRAGVGVEQVELTEEEVQRQHDEENEAEYCDFTRSYFHKLLEISVVKLSFRLNRSCFDLFAGKGLENLCKRVLRPLLRVVAAKRISPKWVAPERICISRVALVVIAHFGVLRRLFLEHVGGSYRHKNDVVYNCKDYEPYYNANQNFVQLAEKFQLEQIKGNIQVEQRVFDVKIRTVCKFEDFKPKLRNCHRRGNNPENHRKPVCGTAEFLHVRCLRGSNLCEVTLFEVSQVKEHQPRHYDESRYSDL